MGFAQARSTHPTTRMRRAVVNNNEKYKVGWSAPWLHPSSGILLRFARLAV
jgi:hypothetical protein